MAKKDKSKKADPMDRVGMVKLTSVVLSHPHLYDAQAAVKDGKKKRKATFIIDPETKSGKANIKAVKAAMDEAAMDHFKKPMEKVHFREGRVMGIEGDKIVSEKTGETPAEYQGMFIVKAANESRPTTVNRRGVTVTKEDDVFYGGAIVDAYVRFYGLSGEDYGGNGLFCGLEGVQFREDGERFGAAPLSPDAFGNLDDDADDGDGGDDFPDDDEKKSKKDKKKKDKKSKKDKKKKKDSLLD